MLPSWIEHFLFIGSATFAVVSFGHNA